MTYVSTLRTGYTDHASELVSVWHGSSIGGVPVVMCHGAGGSATEVFNSDTSFCPRGFGDRGLTGFCADLGGQSTWGNQAFIDAVDDVIAWGASTYGTRTDKVAVWGYSMGGLGLNWVWRNTAKVAAAAFEIPVVALEAIHDKEPQYAGLIEAAYGGLAGYQAALPAHDPMRNTALLAPLADKIRLWYSPTDSEIDAADVTAFAAAVGCTAVNVGNVGHTLAWDQQQVLDWLVPLCWRA